MNKLKLIKKILERFNLWDFLLKVIMDTPKAQLIKTLTEITGEKSIIKKFMSNPDLVAEDLKKLTPIELARLSEAIAKSRIENGFKDKDTGTNGQALSSSWLIYGVYTPLNSKQGTITITTIQGKSYFFPKPLKLSTWERMKYAQGRNGTGAGQIFWDEYWHKLKGSQPSIGTATIFKLLEFNKRKKQAQKVVRLSKKEIKFNPTNKIKRTIKKETTKKWKQLTKPK